MELQIEDGLAYWHCHKCGAVSRKGRALETTVLSAIWDDWTLHVRGSHAETPERFAGRS
jgi:hypothetical protein